MLSKPIVSLSVSFCAATINQIKQNYWRNPAGTYGRDDKSLQKVDYLEERFGLSEIAGIVLQRIG
jgi:hypothetical protein